MFEVHMAQYNWYVPVGFTIDRMDGRFGEWIFAQYLGPLTLNLNGTVSEMPVGSFLIIPPNTPHSYTCTKPFYHNWIHLRGDVAALTEKYNLQPLRAYLPADASELSELFRVISLAYYERRPYCTDYLRLKAEELLIRTAMQVSLTETITDVDYLLINRLHALRKEIIEYPDADWTIPNMAERLFISQSYFYPLYKKCFGVSPAKDISIIRVEKARVMLKDGLSVAETSERCGFHSVYHFIRQFRALTGCTPGQYRKH